MSEEYSNVKVCVRCRPVFKGESTYHGGRKFLNIGERELRISDNEGKHPRVFNFDKVFSECSNEDVYVDCVRNLVEGCFIGLNATVLAYGQSGTGKTWTMGSEMGQREEGVIPLAVRDIFHTIRNKKCQIGEDITLRVTFIEIYNEECKDLLHADVDSKDIYIREDTEGKIFFSGAKDVTVNSIEEVFACLKKGSSNRTTGQTLLNSISSRSHAIFTLSLEVYEPTTQTGGSKAAEKNGDAGHKPEKPSSPSSSADTPACAIPQPIEVTVNETRRHGKCIHAKLHLVDLAGSERAKRTGATGARLKESVGINQGLMTLGKVIRALTTVIPPSSSKRRNSVSSIHVPYRESKLTRLLQDSLGGNSRTVMIACISPAQADIHETIMTLQYATRTRAVQNHVVSNIDTVVDLEEAKVLRALAIQLINLQTEKRRQSNDSMDGLLSSLDTDSDVLVIPSGVDREKKSAGLLFRMREEIEHCHEDLRRFSLSSVSGSRLSLMSTTSTVTSRRTSDVSERGSKSTGRQHGLSLSFSPGTVHDAYRPSLASPSTLVDNFPSGSPTIQSPIVLPMVLGRNIVTHEGNIPPVSIVSAPNYSIKICCHIEAMPKKVCVPEAGLGQSSAGQHVGGTRHRRCIDCMDDPNSLVICDRERGEWCSYQFDSVWQSDDSCCDMSLVLENHYIPEVKDAISLALDQCRDVCVVTCRSDSLMVPWGSILALRSILQSSIKHIYFKLSRKEDSTVFNEDGSDTWSDVIGEDVSNEEFIQQCMQGDDNTHRIPVLDEDKVSQERLNMQKNNAGIGNVSNKVSRGKIMLEFLLESMSAAKQLMPSNVHKQVGLLRWVEPAEVRLNKHLIKENATAKRPTEYKVSISMKWLRELPCDIDILQFETVDIVEAISTECKIGSMSNAAELWPSSDLEAVSVIEKALNHLESILSGVGTSVVQGGRYVLTVIKIVPTIVSSVDCSPDNTTSIMFVDAVRGNDDSKINDDLLSHIVTECVSGNSDDTKDAVPSLLFQHGLGNTNLCRDVLIMGTVCPCEVNAAGSRSLLKSMEGCKYYPPSIVPPLQHSLSNALGDEEQSVPNVNTDEKGSRQCEEVLSPEHSDDSFVDTVNNCTLPVQLAPPDTECFQHEFADVTLQSVLSDTSIPLPTMPPPSATSAPSLQRDELEAAVLEPRGNVLMSSTIAITGTNSEHEPSATDSLDAVLPDYDPLNNSNDVQSTAVDCSITSVEEKKVVINNNIPLSTVASTNFKRRKSAVRNKLASGEGGMVDSSTANVKKSVSRITGGEYDDSAAATFVAEAAAAKEKLSNMKKQMEQRARFHQQVANNRNKNKAATIPGVTSASVAKEKGLKNKLTTSGKDGKNGVVVSKEKSEPRIRYDSATGRRVSVSSTKSLSPSGNFPSPPVSKLSKYQRASMSTPISFVSLVTIGSESDERLKKKSSCLNSALAGNVADVQQRSDVQKTCDSIVDVNLPTNGSSARAVAAPDNSFIDDTESSVNGHNKAVTDAPSVSDRDDNSSQVVSLVVKSPESTAVEKSEAAVGKVSANSKDSSMENGGRRLGKMQINSDCSWLAVNDVPPTVSFDDTVGIVHHDTSNDGTSPDTAELKVGVFGSDSELQSTHVFIPLDERLVLPFNASVNTDSVDAAEGLKTKTIPVTAVPVTKATSRLASIRNKHKQLMTSLADTLDTKVVVEPLLKGPFPRVTFTDSSNDETVPVGLEKLTGDNGSNCSSALNGGSPSLNLFDSRDDFYYGDDDISEDFEPIIKSVNYRDRCSYNSSSASYVEEERDDVIDMGKMGFLQEEFLSAKPDVKILLDSASSRSFRQQYAADGAIVLSSSDSKEPLNEPNVTMSLPSVVLPEENNIESTSVEEERLLPGITPVSLDTLQSVSAADTGKAKVKKVSLLMRLFSPYKKKKNNQHSS